MQKNYLGEWRLAAAMKEREREKQEIEKDLNERKKFRNAAT